jgi:hypothetical protein
VRGVGEQKSESHHWPSLLVFYRYKGETYLYTLSILGVQEVRPNTVFYTVLINGKIEEKCILLFRVLRINSIKSLPAFNATTLVKIPSVLGLGVPKGGYPLPILL